MEDARALLDSLMGQTRDEKKTKRQKASGGNGFKQESVCKLHLVGFCPEHEELFHNTRRDLGPCYKTHFDVHKREFNEHPDKAKYQAHYDALLLRHLSSILKRCDEWIVREKAKNEVAIANNAKRGAGPSAGVCKLRDKASESIAEAEELASKGDIEASKLLVNAAQEYEKKAKEYEGQGVSGSQVCDICGGIKEAGNFLAFKHEEGKVHKGIVAITTMVKDLKKKEAKGELKMDRDIEKEELKDKDREAKERRAKEREAREQEAKERRANEREAKEREERRKQEQTRRQEQAARDRDTRDREAGDRRRQDRSRSARRGIDRGDGQSHRERFDGRVDRGDGRGRREDGANRRDRREDSLPDRCGDRRAEGGTTRHRGKHNDGNDSGSGAGPSRGVPNADASEKHRMRSRSPEESTHDEFKQRASEKAFTDLLIRSNAVTATSTYEDLERLLGDELDWMKCDVESRRFAANSFIDCLKEMPYVPTDVDHS